MPISDARRRANEKYNAKAYEEIKIRVKKGQKDIIKAAADKSGDSLNEYINKAILQRMEQEQTQGGDGSGISTAQESDF